MFKKSAVALALFAGLLTSQAFAQSLVVASADPTPPPTSVSVGVQNTGSTALLSACVEIRFYGTNVIGMMRDDPAITSTTVICGALAANQGCQLAASLPWATYARILNLNGPLYFKARVRWILDANYHTTVPAPNSFIFAVLR